MFIRKKKGQSVLEYAILVGVVIAVIIAIQLYIKRAVQGNLKARSDAIGDQFTTATDYTTENIQQTARREAYQTDAVVGTEVSRSEIVAAADGQAVKNQVAGYSKAAAYTGAELSSSDYVTADAGGAAVLGVHGSFDSGKLTDTGLFDDD